MRVIDSLHTIPINREDEAPVTDIIRQPNSHSVEREELSLSVSKEDVHPGALNVSHPRYKETQRKPTGCKSVPPIMDEELFPDSRNSSDNDDALHSGTRSTLRQFFDATPATLNHNAESPSNKDHHTTSNINSIRNRPSLLASMLNTVQKLSSAEPPVKSGRKSMPHTQGSVGMSRDAALENELVPKSSLASIVEQDLPVHSGKTIKRSMLLNESLRISKIARISDSANSEENESSKDASIGNDSGTAVDINPRTNLHSLVS